MTGIFFPLMWYLQFLVMNYATKEVNKQTRSKIRNLNLRMCNGNKKGRETREITFTSNHTSANFIPTSVI